MEKESKKEISSFSTFRDRIKAVADEDRIHFNNMRKFDT